MVVGGSRSAQTGGVSAAVEMPELARRQTEKNENGGENGRKRVVEGTPGWRV